VAKRQQKPARREYLPDRFITMLAQGIHGYGAESPQVQFQLTQLILSASKKTRQHKDIEGATAISYQELYKRFGRGKFKQINQRLNIFESTPNWWHSKGFTKGYWLTDPVIEIKKKFLDSKPKQSSFVYEDGSVMHNIPQAIAAKSFSGHTAKNKGQIEALTPVNADNLRMYARALQKYLDHMATGAGHTPDMFTSPHPAMIERYRDRLERSQMILHYLMTDVGQNKYLPHRYEEGSTGRLHTIGSVSLQNSPREVRQAAMQGCWDYDFENCHYQIFSHLAHKAGCDPVAIDDYLKRKKQIREQLTADIGADIGSIKQCLIALIYGAENSAYWDAAIPRVLGKRVKKFESHPIIQGIRADLEQCTDSVISNYPVSRVNKITNDMGLTIHTSAGDKSVLAHILQGMEARMLQVCRLKLGNKIVLLQHDGFATTTKVSIPPLKKAIYEATGIRMQISEELLQTPAHLIAEIPKRQLPYQPYESSTYPLNRLPNAS